MLDYALAYADRGWRVHPLKPRDKTPITKNGCKDATIDPTQIQKWWKQWPNANIGLATGYQFFVIDIDPDGMSWYEAQGWPITAEAVTGRGGRHLLYRMPENYIIANSAGKLAKGVDVRGIGGYIVAPPSIHPSGTPYAWLDAESNTPETPISDAPPDLIAAIAEQPIQKFSMPEVIAEGSRDNTLFKFACSLRAQEFSEDEIRVALEVRNRRCTPPLPASDLDRIAKSAASKPAGKSERFRNHTPEPTSEVYDAEIIDDGHSAKLVPNAVGDHILKNHRFLNVDGYLYEYIGTHWEMISLDRLKALALEADGPFHTATKRRNEIADYIRLSTHRKDQEWRKLADYECPVGNGVIDIRSMSLRPHRPEDFIQACPPVKFFARGQCPLWMRCLDDYFGGDSDQEAKMSALQEFFGYCLMPHAKYKRALFCKGESNCGKSTIPFVIRELIGHRNCSSVSVEDMDDAEARTPLMTALVNVMSELTSDAMIKDGGFKTLVSTEEAIQFNPKYLPRISLAPTAKHIFVTNKLPMVNDRSRGTFNRILLLHFDHVIPDRDQDKDLQAKLRREMQGILSWALEGAQRLYHSAGEFTAAGAIEVEKYRKDQNPINAFIADECEIGDELRSHIADLRTRFVAHHGKPITAQAFKSLIESAGYAITPNPVWIGAQKRHAVIGVGIRSGA